MKYEYHDGPKAGENFQKLAMAVFRAKGKAVPAKSPAAAQKKAAPKASGKKQG